MTVKKTPLIPIVRDLEKELWNDSYFIDDTFITKDYHIPIIRKTDDSYELLNISAQEISIPLIINGDIDTLENFFPVGEFEFSDGKLTYIEAEYPDTKITDNTTKYVIVSRRNKLPFGVNFSKITSSNIELNVVTKNTTAGFDGCKFLYCNITMCGGHTTGSVDYLVAAAGFYQTDFTTPQIVLFKRSLDSDCIEFAIKKNDDVSHYIVGQALMYNRLV